jgi:hypothetical protein
MITVELHIEGDTSVRTVMLDSGAVPATGDTVKYGSAAYKVIHRYWNLNSCSAVALFLVFTGGLERAP